MSTNEKQSNVVLVDGEDPALQQAYKQAKQTFKFFWRELSWENRRIIPGLDLAYIKVAFSDPPEKANPDNPSTEYMWVSDVDFDGRRITGTLMNSPNWISVVKEGDRVRVSPKKLCDWMYGIRGKVYGGHTINLMRAKMGRAERKQHDSAWGLDFGDPGVIELVPPDYLGRKKKGFLGRILGGSKSEPQDPREVAQIEHPMAMNMLPGFKEFIEKTPSALTESDDRNGFTQLHYMALAGAAESVKLLLSMGAEVEAKTKGGLTADQLAKVLGWNDVRKVIAEHQS